MPIHDLFRNLKQSATVFALDPNGHTLGYSCTYEPSEEPENRRSNGHRLLRLAHASMATHAGTAVVVRKPSALAATPSCLQAS